MFLCSLISSKAQFSGQGAGTESDPYQVTNPFELYQMSFFLNKENVYFSLMQDIDLGDWLAENFPSSGWTPLGTYDTPFKGVLRGNGKTIKNIFINRTGDYTGLFGYTNGATITDLNIYDGNVVGGQYCGMLVGYANSTTIIDNCEANGTVDASNTYVGGLCGFQNGGSLTNCRFNGNVSGTQFVGGLCGYQDGGSLTNCGFNGNVSGSGNVGGVSGKIATSTVDNCSCEGNVTGKGNYVGGIVGYTNYATITNSICKATVSGSSYVGGIAGYFDRYVKQEGKYINKCIFKGDVIGAGCVGGIVGLIFSLYPSNNYVSTNIQNDTQSRYISGCIAIGNITASGNNVGGIAGQSNHFSIDNCYFSGEITGKDYTGGIVGNLQLSVNNSFYNNYSKAKVSGTSYLGGLIGYYNSYSGSHKIQSNVAINSEIYATQSTVGLIYGGLSGTDYSQSVGSTYSNRSLSTTEVYVNDVKQTMTDNDKKNGTPTALFMLKLASSYEAWGWNFTNTWYMNSETGLPDLMWNMVVEEQTLAFSELPTMTYGNADYTLPATTDQGLTLTWTSNNANVAVVEGNILKIKGAGSATITAIQEGTNNYESFTREFPLTVKKAKLTITADDKTKDEGDENPSLTVTYSGFKYNDSESSLQSLPTLSTTATKDSGQGTYPITVEGAKSNNYSITYVGGTLTVLGKVKTAYAVYLNGTLTFYYDTKSEQKNGELYDNLTRANADDKWGAHKLDIIRVVFDSSFANATPTSTAYWFNGCTNAEEIVGLEYLNTSKVTSMYSMFNAIGKNSKKMTTLDVSGFTTGKVKNMGSMFKNNTSLTTIFVGEGWTTESVTNSTNMFSSCSKLVGGDGTKYSSSYVDKTRAYAGRGGYLSVKSQAPTVEAKEYSVYLNNTLTFYYDNNYGNRAGEVYTSLLKSSNADKWGAYKDVLSKVVFDESFKDARPTSTANWFNGCTYVEEVVGLEYLNTSEVTSMYAMFNAMGKSTKTMTVLDISGFATSKVTNMGSMFKNNSYLKTIYIGEGWTTDKVTTSTNMFYGCSRLVGGDGTKFLSNYTDKTRAFAGLGGYMTLLGSNAKDINDADFAATAIDDVESVATGDVYTLQGIYVGKNVDMRTLPKGIYIVGGKKVTVGF